jgi:uncharacterized cupredoxin-like copper-binding protein
VKWLLLAVPLALLVGCGPSNQVTITFHYSHFTPDVVRVRAGVPVRVTLRNDDPIDHEWIVGSAAVHDVHRRGTEAVHSSVPTEVSVPALSTRTTTITFPAGEEAFICHLPGHEEYGMTGLLNAS